MNDLYVGVLQQYTSKDELGEMVFYHKEAYSTVLVSEERWVHVSTVRDANVKIDNSH